jgi:uncharacterized protein (TIRG00374 family)
VGPQRTVKVTLWGRVRRWGIALGVLLVALYTYAVMTAGGRDLADVISTLDPFLLSLPLFATLLSYLTMSLSYEGIARAAGSDIRQRDMLRITFVANTANYVLPTGGFSGFALRMMMLKKKGVTAGRAVLISFTQTLLTNVMLVVFILYGLLHMIASGNLDGGSVAAVAAVSGILFAFLGSCLLMVYRQSARDLLLGKVLDICEAILVRFGYFDQYKVGLHRFFLHIDEGMEFFAERPRAMVGPLAWIFLDWVFTIAVLYAAFYSVGADVSYSDVVIAFSVAIVVAVVSFVPGGVGVLDATLFAMFARTGIPDEQSVLALMIFRVSFYVIPVLLSLAMARSAFADVNLDESGDEDGL